MVKSVAIYCASSNEIDATYGQDASKLATLLVKENIGIVNGGGNMGLMQVVSNAALAAGGAVTGVIPAFMMEKGWHQQNLTRLIEVSSMHERKKTIADLSDAAIALPGGYGTFEELLEIITWRQLELYRHPVIILNTNGFYDPMLEMFKRATNEKFIRSEYLSLWKAVKTPEDAISALMKN